MSKPKTQPEIQPEIVTMWGAFYKGGYPGDGKLLGVFKLKKNAIAAAKHQSSGSADGFFPAFHFDGVVKDVECVLVGDVAYPIQHGVPVEPKIKTPKHDCRFCLADRMQAADRKAKREARKRELASA